MNRLPCLSVSASHLDTSKHRFGKPITALVKLAHLEQYSSLLMPNLELCIYAEQIDLSAYVNIALRFGKPITAPVKLAHLEPYSSLLMPNLDLCI